MKTAHYTLLVCIFLLLFLTGCGSQESTMITAKIVEPSSITIGAIQSLTGSAMRHGEDARMAIELAVDDVNKVGGINGKTLQVLYEDEQCDAKLGISATRKLININKIPVIIGPTCSGTALAIAPILEENKVVMITHTSSTNKLKHSGDFIFRNRVMGGVFSEKIAHFAFNKLNARTAAILYINKDNGISYRDAFKKTFVGLGGVIVQEEAYDQGSDDFRTQLTKIKAQNPDVVYLAGQDHENAVKQAKELGVQSKIIGPLTMETPELLELAGPGAEGIYYSYPPFDPLGNQQMQGFNTKYKKRFGKNADAYAANAYDATLLIAEGLRQCDTNTVCIRDYLYGVENYKGVSGTMTFDAYGEVSKPLIIKTVKDSKFVKVIDRLK